MNGWPEVGSPEQDLDFDELKGQQHVKRAVEVAAAGGHNILTFGPISPNNFELRFLSEIFGIVVDPAAFFADALRSCTASRELSALTPHTELAVSQRGEGVTFQA
jgi:magnesium chelatase family protein